MTHTRGPSSSTPTLCGSQFSSLTKKAIEPQNLLTRCFTEAEWSALKNLRPRLPEICRAAFAGNEIKSFSIWGVTIDPMNPMGDARVSVVLMKFLRVKKLDVDATQALLVEVLDWRHKISIDELVEQKRPSLGKPPVKFGRDKEGRPVYYCSLDIGYFKRTWVEQDTNPKAWIIRLSCAWEKLSRALDFETADDVTSVKEFDPPVSLEEFRGRSSMARVKYIGENYYPDIGTRSILLNFKTPIAHPFRTAPLSLFRRRKDTSATTQVVGTSKSIQTKKLLEIIDAEQLPKQFGGNAEGFVWRELEFT